MTIVCSTSGYQDIWKVIDSEQEKNSFMSYAVVFVSVFFFFQRMFVESFVEENSYM